MKILNMLWALLLVAACGSGRISVDAGVTDAGEEEGDAAVGGDSQGEEPKLEESDNAGGDALADGDDVQNDQTLPEDAEDGADQVLDGGDTEPEHFGAEFFVATDGDDTNPGTFEKPFATFERARQAVRELKASDGLPEKGVAVWIRGGLYLLSATLELGAEDSGEEGRPVVWAAWPGEKVRIAGARPIPASIWQPVQPSMPVWERLDESARGKVMVADLSTAGISDFGVLKPRGFSSSAPAALELFADGVPLDLARWPDPEENDPRPTPLDPQITLYGQPVPDVTGVYVADGTSDGVNRFRRQGLVDGRQYYLYRYNWDYQGRNYTAWFLAAQETGYPGNAAPWWYLYSQDFGTLQPANGATGNVTPFNPAAINHGFVAIAEAIDDTTFKYVGDRPVRWSQAEEIWFHGYWKYMWADLHVMAASIDTASRTVQLVQKPGYGIETAQPYYAENLLEEITRPGEWYLNRSEGELYLWPPKPVEQMELLASTLDGLLVRVNNASFIEFRDLVLEATRRRLVEISGGRRVRLYRCELRNAGNYCAAVSGEENGLELCLVHDCGDGGVALSGGVRSSLTRGNNFVRNSELYRFSRWSWTYQPAVRISGCGQLVAHNLMYDAPHSAILYSGNEHLIEFNDVHSVCRFSSDAGAIYAGRDWGYRGNRIRFNFIHHIDTYFEGYGVHGVYLDDCLSGIEVFGNIIYRVSGLGILHGGGRDNIMHNNIIAHCGAAMSADNRGLLWITNTPGDSWNLLERLHADGIKYQEDPWASAYPPLAAIPDDWSQISDPAQHWREPEGCVFSRNLGFANAEFMVESVWAGDGVFIRYADISNNIADQDPLFVDEANLDLRLRPDSPAFTIPGFVDIPFEQIGIKP